MCEMRPGDQNAPLLKPAAVSGRFVGIVRCHSNVFTQRTTTATMDVTSNDAPRALQGVNEEAAAALKVPLCDESIHMGITALLSQPLYTVGNKMLLQDLRPN